MLISVPATSANLGPGFDTLGIAINLRNYVDIRPSRIKTISLKGEGADNPKLKDNNMFLTIFNDFLKKNGNKEENYRFEFVNNVPISRGLGSSSAVIISAIASAYGISSIDVSKHKILNFALSYEGHPDNITPAVMGGFTCSIVENESVKFIKKRVPRDIQAVLVIPNRPISTNQSRKVLPLKYSKNDTIYNVSHSSFLTGVFMSEKWDFLRIASKDRMHQDYRMKQFPELFEVQKSSLNSGALMSTLSGSGSTFFNIVYRDDANRIKNRLQKQFSKFRVMICDFDNDGLKLKSN
jgi:homoserine kinase